MSFANPFFLAALAAVALPILIHLLTRDRVQHVAFSTLRFFAKGAKMVVRRKKNQELILLLLRMALLALLALAFARPFFEHKVVDTRHEFGKALVVVADVSGSMQRPGLREELSKKAGEAVSSLHEGSDSGALIAFADTPAVVEAFGQPITKLSDAAANLKPGYEGTNIAEALRRANELLQGIRARQKEIVLISDLQRIGWNDFKGDWKLAANVKLTIDALKPSDPGDNLAISELSAPDNLVLDKQPSAIAIRVANFSDQPRNNVKVTLSLGAQQVETQQINVRGHGRVAVRFRHVFQTAGDNPGSVALGSESPPADGHVVYFNAHAIPRIPVLLIDGHPSQDEQADSSFFLEKALVPVPDSPFAVTTIAADKVTPADVNAATVVVLANVGQVSAGIPEAMKGLLDRGGGLFFLPGDQVTAEKFNADFGDLAPCHLQKVLDAQPADGATAESLTRIDFHHPILATFAQPHHGDLTLPKFSKYWETTGTQLSDVLARFGDDRPAFIARQIGQGTSVILVSAIESGWTDFARQSVFLPFVHQTVRYLAVQTARPTTFTCGAALPVPAGDALKGPDGAMRTSEGGRASGTIPGIYTAVKPDGQVDACFAVNVNLAENNPATVASDEIISALGRSSEEGVADMETGSVSPTNGPQSAGFWWYLLWLVVILSLVELVVGNKTLRH